VIDYSKCIRKEARPPRKRIRGSGSIYYDPNYVYIFQCSSCSKEMPLQPNKWKTHSGYCVRCVKRKNKPYHTLYARLLTSAKKEGREVELTYEEFEFLTQIGVCNYCNSEIKWNEFKAGPYNLDRKDNTKGYSFENVVVSCKECNFMKNRFYSFEEFKAISEVLKIMRGNSKERKTDLISSLCYTPHTSL